MDAFGEMLGVTHFDTIKFFHQGLKEVSVGRNVTPETKVYIASILADFAQTPRGEDLTVATPTNLAEIFDAFVLSRLIGKPTRPSPELLEVAGARCLLVNGFFRDYMRRRHSVEWFDKLGSSFYDQAGSYQKKAEKRSFLKEIAGDFSNLAETCSALNKHLQESKYLLQL